MALQDKWIGGVLIAHAVLGAAWACSIASQHGFPQIFLISNLALATIGVVSGFGYFVGRYWAALLGILFYAIQVIHVLAPNLHFSFTLGINLVIALGWFKSGQIGINLFALAMLIWLSIRLGKAKALLTPINGMPETNSSK